MNGAAAARRGGEAAAQCLGAPWGDLAFPEAIQRKGREQKGGEGEGEGEGGERRQEGGWRKQEETFMEKGERREEGDGRIEVEN